MNFFKKIRDEKKADENEFLNDIYVDDSIQKEKKMERKDTKLYSWFMRNKDTIFISAITFLSGLFLGAEFFGKDSDVMTVNDISDVYKNAFEEGKKCEKNQLCDRLYSGSEIFVHSNEGGRMIIKGEVIDEEGGESI